ncbi:hypothetical protein VHA01S_060_00150 [Vibrio halioticoli NBRC 102217]|uniref:Uncharacterized protein n=1 Tax=Vibrio halioticoli NBRC 102217 TaxID=1219072 RepID=V5FMV4_9VIBR|nr:hypothetical protein [Vibrio halioticoli]GAD90921.1 hypothetical protein VHA01S_060_00150 [Vibrio halioticoli NBRC 102217]
MFKYNNLTLFLQVKFKTDKGQEAYANSLLKRRKEGDLGGGIKKASGVKAGQRLES